MEARIGWLLALCMSLLLAPLPAQDGKFSLTAAFEPATAKPGDEVELVLRATVAQHWHAYGSLETVNIPVALTADNLLLNGLEAVGAANVPPGIPKPGPIGTQYPLPNSFRVVQKLRVPDGVSGKVTVEGELDYQICDESACEPPSKAAFTATLDVQGQGGGGEPAKKEPAPMPDLGFKPGLTLDPDTRVVVRATFEPDTARPGEHVTLVLRAVTQDGWHAYGWREAEREFGQTPVGLDQTAQDVGDLEFVGEPVIPPGEPHEVFGETQYQLGHEFEVRQVLRVPEGAEAGNVKVGGVMIYQVCNETGCEPDAEAEYETVLHVEAGEVRDAYREPPTAQSTGGGDDPKDGEPKDAGVTPVVDEPPTADEDDDNPFTKGWWALILACIGGGLFALAMPCTYPMIPITFSFFTKQSEKFGGGVLVLSIVYGLGIVTMFVVVGVSLAEVIVPIVNHWVTNTLIGVAFFFFAFVLFGWVNLNPPQWMNRLAAGATQKASGGQSGAGVLGALVGVFFMGATLVITSFTCTAPIVGSLLASVAKAGSVKVGVGMGIFGLTMAIPFMLLALAPGKVKAMPKAGQWMDTLKISLGFIELAAAFKFVSMVDIAFGWQALPRELFLMLWAAIFAMWALFLFGILRKAGAPNEGVGNGRMAAGMAVTMLAAYFLFGALGNRLDSIMTGFVPAYRNSLASAAKKEHPYELVYDAPARAVEVAKRDDKLLLYNFTGFN